jgi:hypothetical protein
MPAMNGLMSDNGKMSEDVKEPMLRTREGVAGSCDGAGLTVTVTVYVAVRTKKKNTLAARLSVMVSVRVPLPNVAVRGPAVNTKGIQVPPVSRPHSHRYPPGIAVGATLKVEARVLSVAAEIGAAGNVKTVPVAGDAGSGLTTPDRRRSPVVPVSVTITDAAAPAGGTALDAKVKVRGTGAEEVAVSIALPALGGLKIEPASTGTPLEKKPPKSNREMLSVQGIVLPNSNLLANTIHDAYRRYASKSNSMTS